MVSAKRLVDMARKWQKMAAGKRKRITYPRRRNMDMHYSGASKGHFAVYSVDHKRFMVPLKHLSNDVFKELLKWSEEEFGLCSDGPIRLPCDGVLLEYVISLMDESVPEEIQKALINSMDTCHGVASSSALALTQYSHQHQQARIRGF
ncbi:auxin-responsive protein SAUR68-like [Senna tora]|uniref:Auxin-responsive protein SAUR68-like n=1 Tax=Senna tora TaxID=362788 RepID=A0A834XBM8_9FABA|nr:auxin-responsive protein SAUR68-like [Senna tora]